MFQRQVYSIAKAGSINNLKLIDPPLAQEYWEIIS